MDRHRLLASMVAAALVGAALVVLWPRPDPASRQVAAPDQPSALGEAHEPLPALPDPPASTSAPTPSEAEALLVAHLERGQERWRDLARQAARSDDPFTRALTPELEAMAELAPEPSALPGLQATVALLEAELAMASRLEASDLPVVELSSELQALEAAWIGPTPVDHPRDPR